MPKFKNKITGEIVEAPDKQSLMGMSNQDVLNQVTTKFFGKTPQQEFAEFAQKEEFKQGLKNKQDLTTAVKTEQQKKQIRVQELLKVVDLIEGKFDELNPGKGVGGRIQGLTTKQLQSFSQSNPKIAAYHSFIRGIRPILSRGLGDVGNLSETEQQAAMELLPNDKDNYQTGVEKLKNFRDLLNLKINTTSGEAESTPSTMDASSILKKYGL
jgi:hypothetical protein